MKGSEILTRYLRNMEYVIMWTPIPYRDRPKYNVIKNGHGFKLVKKEIRKQLIQWANAYASSIYDPGKTLQDHTLRKTGTLPKRRTKLMKEDPR